MFDAFNHGLTTMPSGGFSTHDASIAYYDSFVVESIIICFMSCWCQFHPHRLAWEKQWDKVFADQEGRSYVLVITATTLFVFIALMSQGSRIDEGFFDSLFTVVSIGTSTGYTSTDYMLVSCNSHFLIPADDCWCLCRSTSGGLKLMRVKLV